MVRPARLEGEITPPGDKSISHRALILNALARGEARVTNLAPGQDLMSTAACLQALGVSLASSDGAIWTVLGAGLGGLKEPANVMDAGNSGTTMRLVAGVLAGQPFLSVLTGDGSLRSRPMARIVQPLKLMGAQVWGRQGDTRAPLAIRGGKLRGIDYALPVASAQLKSCLLLAGLFAEGVTSLSEPAPSRDHTERMLQAMGARIHREGTRVRLDPLSAPLTALDIQVPGDISAAAFWLVAGALHPNARITLRGVGLNPYRTGVLDALEAMGARITVGAQRQIGAEPVADITVESSELRGTELGGALIPRTIDELPVLAVAASLARGQTVIRDAAELRAKESDRIGLLAAELSRFGARVTERPDGMVIQGQPALRGTCCASHGDHRLAMALAVAGLVAQGETVVDGAEAVEISYPKFWQHLSDLSRS